MTQTTNKNKCLALLRNGVPIDEVSKQTGVHETVINEWLDDAIPVNETITISNTDLLHNALSDMSPEDLKNSLLTTARAFVDKLGYYGDDIELYKPIVESIKAIALLQKSFFPVLGDGVQITLDASQNKQVKNAFIEKLRD